MTPRSPSAVALLLAIVFSWFLVSGFWSQIETARTAEPVEVTVWYRAPATVTHAAVTYFDRKGFEIVAQTTSGQERGLSGTWEIRRGWVRNLRLYLPADQLDSIEKVDVRLGKAAFSFDRVRLLDAWHQESPRPSDELAKYGRIIFEAPESVRSADSRLPGAQKIQNWPGDGVFLAHMMIVAAVATAAALVLVVLGRIAGRLGPHPGIVMSGLGWRRRDEDGRSEASPARRNGPWFAFGLVVLAVAVALLELRDPYYFTEDDNFAQFLPVIIHGCSVLADGAFPTYNPYQLLGAPTASAGVYALSYPGTWLSCAIAGAVLDDPGATIEVFALLHLMPGFAAAFWAGRILGVRPSLACAAALSFALCGFFLIAGRSWYYMLPIATWTPLLVVALEKLRRGEVGVRWTLLTGLVIGVFFHAGNVQMWSYTVVFLALALCLLWYAGEIGFEKVLWSAAALLVGVAIAAPLLVPQWEFASGLERSGGHGGGVAGGLLAMVLPYPLVEAGHPNESGNIDVQYMGHFYYAGTVIIGAGFAAILALLAIALANEMPRQTVARNLWLICGGVALVLALGNRMPLWGLMSHVPPFTKFNEPFKFLVFTILFLSLGGALFLDNLLRRSERLAHYGPVVAVVTGLLMLGHMWLARPSFYTYAEDPYPPLPLEVAEVLGAGTGAPGARVVSISPLRTVAPGYVATLQHNFATLFGVPSIDGYDPLVRATEEYRAAADRLWRNPLESLREYGVRWYLHYDPRVITVFNESASFSGELLYDAQRFLRDALSKHGVVRLEREGVTIYELPGARPLAFAVAAPEEPLPFRVEGDTFIVELPEGPGDREVVLNFLWRPGIEVRANGRAVASAADGWGRIVATVPPQGGTLSARYVPSWGRGLSLAALLALAAVAVMLFAGRSSRRRGGTLRETR